MTGIQDKKWRDLLMRLIVATDREVKLTGPAKYLIIYLMDTPEKITLFADWLKDNIPEGNPNKVDSEMIERIVNKINLGLELPTL